MSEPITDADLLAAVCEIECQETCDRENCDEMPHKACHEYFERGDGCRHTYLRELRAVVALAAGRAAGIAGMAPQDIKQAKANSARPEHTAGYIAGRQDAAAGIRRALCGGKE